MTQVLLRQHLFKSTEKWIKTESYWLHIKRRKGGVEEYFVIYKITIIVRIEDKLCASYYTKHFIWRFYFNSFLEIPLPILQIKWSETPGKWLINNSNQLSVILSLSIHIILSFIKYWLTTYEVQSLCSGATLFDRNIMQVAHLFQTSIAT